MNFDLTDDQLSLQKMVADFAQREIAPRAEQLDHDGVFPMDLFRRAGELGLVSIPFPESQGGMGLGILDTALAIEQLARADQSFAVSLMVSITNGLILSRFGPTPLIERYLPDIVAGRKVCGAAGTEPDAGSDTAAFKTRAVQEGGGWRISGQKAYITNAGPDINSFLIVLAVTSPPDEVKKSFSTFIVPAGAVGFSAGPPYRKMGWRSSDTRPLYFDGCIVEAGHLMGEVGKGRYILHSAYQQARVFLAACSLGLAQACLEQSIAYAKSRNAFGGPIGRLQLVQELVAKMALEVDVARLLTYRAAWNVDQGKANPKELAMAKLYACEAGTRCADMAVQVHGGWGYMDDCPVSRYYRDNRICTIGDGSTQVQTLLIARACGLEVNFA